MDNMNTKEIKSLGIFKDYILNENFWPWLERMRQSLKDGVSAMTTNMTIFLVQYLFPFFVLFKNRNLFYVY